MFPHHFEIFHIVQVYYNCFRFFLNFMTKREAYCRPSFLSYALNQAALQLFFCFLSQSCKAGKGPEFSKNVFDVHGRSPLIEQYLRSNHLSKDAGMAILVRRTEIESLPPYPFHLLEFTSLQKFYA